MNPASRITRRDCLKFATAAGAALWLPRSAFGSTAPRDVLLVDAPSFSDKGGWVVDQQNMGAGGAAYLMAHGAGTPVMDATTTVAFPAPGEYFVHVRTRDWVAPWKKPGVHPAQVAEGAPGKFQVSVDGQRLAAVFGTEGEAWHWQKGGKVVVKGPEAALALHDLTGFNGRCEAILFARAEGFTPPETDAEIRQLREALAPEEVLIKTFDLVVVGGGIAGMSVALTAASLGMKVALVQNRPVVGGNASSECGVPPAGGINLPPYPALGNLMKQIPTTDKERLELLMARKNLSVFLNMQAVAVDMAAKDRIRSVTAQHIETGRRTRFVAPLFADCTGDATLGFLAGAEWRMGREGRDQHQERTAPERPDRLLMGHTVHWRSKAGKEDVEFPSCPWALRMTEDTLQRYGKKAALHSTWDWETGFEYDPIAEIENVRDYKLRAIFGQWDCVKNRVAEKADYRKLAISSNYIIGKRESRRLLGDVICTENDIFSTQFPDACVGTKWHIDLHYANKGNEKVFGRAFRAVVLSPKHSGGLRPYPYRCFYSRNIANLFMAGRHVSVTHVALGPLRVQKQLSVVGEVVGMAASVCAEQACGPREVYAKHLDSLKKLLERGFEKLGKV